MADQDGQQPDKKLDPGAQHYEHLFDNSGQITPKEAEEQKKNPDPGYVNEGLEDRPDVTESVNQAEADSATPQSSQTDPLKQESQQEQPSSALNDALSASQKPSFTKRLFGRFGFGGGSAKAKMPFQRRSGVSGYITGIGLATILLFAGASGTMLFKADFLSSALNNLFGTFVRSALDRRMSAYMGGWIENDVFVGVRRCGSNVNLQCMNRNQPDPPLGLLGAYILAMRRGEVNRLLVQNGISITYQIEQRQFKIITKAGTIDVGDDAESIGNYKRQLIRGNNAAVREIKRIVNTTFQDRATQRLVTKVLMRHYGLKMCWVFCTTRDNVQIRKDDIGMRLQSYRDGYTGAILNRISLSGSAYQMLLIKCLVGDPCTRSAVRDELRKIDTEEATRLSRDSNKIDDLIEIGREARERGSLASIRKFAFVRAASLFLGEDKAANVTKLGTKAIPVAGWVLIGVGVLSGGGALIGLINNIPPYDGVLEDISQSVKKSQYMGAYNLMNSGSAEMFGSNDDGESFDLASRAAFTQQIGDFERAPPYAYLFGSLQHADTFSGTSNVCPNGFGREDLAPEPGSIHCEMDKLDSLPPFLNEIERFNETYGFMRIAALAAFVGTIPAQLVDALIEGAAEVIGWAIKLIPGVEQALEFAGEQVNEAVQAFLDSELGQALEEAIAPVVGEMFSYLAPMICGTDPSETTGQTLGRCAIIGAEYGNSVFARGLVDENGGTTGLGAPALSDEEANDLLAYYEAEEQEMMKYASVQEKFFALDTPKSLLAQLLVSNPLSSVTTSGHSFISHATNPFAKVFTLSANLITSRVSAQTSVERLGNSGVVQHGFKPDSQYLTSDPLTMTQEECDIIIGRDVKETDERDRAGDPILEMTPEARQCLLDLQAVKLGTFMYTGDEL